MQIPQKWKEGILENSFEDTVVLFFILQHLGCFYGFWGAFHGFKMFFAHFGYASHVTSGCPKRFQMFL